MSRISNKPIQLLKGFKDILPEHQLYWDFFNAKAQKLMQAYSFQKIDVPVLEQTGLYVKGTGKHTDVVSKELYSFEDKGGENVTMRPEFTPGICRAYIEHGMLSQSQPVKLYAFGPVFRHDNPQSGRFRQFHQLNLEAIGSEHPVIDSQLIIISYRLLKSLGLPIVVHLNSIGCSECRSDYIVRLKQYLAAAGRKKELCENCRDRYVKNPLRILDCKNESCQAVLEGAPQIVDYLCEDCKKHFMQVLEQLDDLEIEYNLDVRLVRGLDYYTRTTFELYAREDDLSRAQTALGGGGRYDGLMEILGGRSTPAIGLAIGVERVITKMRELNLPVPLQPAPDVFVAQLGSEARKECYKLFEKLMDEDIKVAENFSKDGLKNQLERADALGVKLSLILGQRELLDRTIIIRDMRSGIQEIVNYDRIVTEVKKRLNTLDANVKSYVMKDETRPDNTAVSPTPTGPSHRPKYKIDISQENEDIINRF